MKPMLIQHLIRNNRKNRKVEPITDEQIEQYRDRSADFVFWFIVFIVVMGLLLA